MPSSIYQNPVYYVGHYFSPLDPGTKFVEPSGTAGDVSRVTDDQELLSYNFNGDFTLVEKNLQIDRGDILSTSEPVFIEEIEKIIVAGHSMSSAFRGIRLQHSANASSWQDIVDNEWGNPITEEYFRPGLRGISDGTSVMGFGTSRLRYVRLIVGQTTSLAQFVASNVGEIYACRPLTTERGIVQSWRIEPLPNNAVTQTFAGNTYTIKRGDSRSIWVMEYARLPSDDYAKLKELETFAGIEERVFYFDPPDAANLVAQDRAQFNASTWNLVNAQWTLGFDTNGPNGVESMTASVPVISPTGTFAEADIPDQLDENGKNLRDFTGRWLSIDFKRDAGTQFGTSTADQRAIRIELLTSENAFKFSATYPFSICEAHRVSVNPSSGGPLDRWYRIFFDIDRQVPIETGNLGRALADIRAIRLNYENPTTSQNGAIYRFANFNIWNPGKTTRAVELIDFDAQQSSQNPAGPLGPLYDVRVAVREVLS